MEILCAAADRRFYLPDKGLRRQRSFPPLTGVVLQHNFGPSTFGSDPSWRSTDFLQAIKYLLLKKIKLFVLNLIQKLPFCPFPLHFCSCLDLLSSPWATSDVSHCPGLGGSWEGGHGIVLGCACSWLYACLGRAQNRAKWINHSFFCIMLLCRICLCLDTGRSSQKCRGYRCAACLHRLHSLCKRARDGVPFILCKGGYA